MKFLLWFEPERVIKTTPIVQEHPEYFISNGKPDDKNLLLNLGNPLAWEYCYKTFSSLIRDLNVNCYRQDCNFSSLEYWRNGDSDERRGITEIKHVNGLYAFWDALLQEIPNLLIDNCAGGGRRIDIELWRSDYQCVKNYNPEAAQCHNLSFNLWTPYSGTSTGRDLDEYRFRSSYSPALNMSTAYPESETFTGDESKLNFTKKYAEEYLRVRPYLSEDFYPITEFSAVLDAWCVMQFNRPSGNDGAILAFRRELSPFATANFNLFEINTDKDYLFEDIDGGQFIISGDKLVKDGFMIEIPSRRQAKIYFYKAL